MITKKYRSRWWIYIHQDSRVGRNIENWLSTPGDKSKDQMGMWLSANASAGWRASLDTYNLKGDPHDYYAVRFNSLADAVLFKMSFDGLSPEPASIPRQWSQAEIDNPKAMTFAKTNRFWKRKAATKISGPLKGADICYWWATERNAAGFFLGGRFINGALDWDANYARRKKKDVLAWVERNII
jgi:hypothetical protein